MANPQLHVCGVWKPEPKGEQMVSEDSRAPCCCFPSAGPSLHSLSLSLSLGPKNLYLLHDAWKHTVFSYNFTWPLTPSAQMQYDRAATIHFGLWSRFNEFLLCCMCMSLGLALSFDPHRHQYVLEIHHLALQNEDVQPLQRKKKKEKTVLHSVFGFGILEIWSKICTVGTTYWVYCLFVFLRFFLFSLFLYLSWQFQQDCDRQISNHVSWQTGDLIDIWIS